MTDKPLRFPKSLKNQDNKLEVGGMSLSELAEKYGTPLYVMDTETVRENCRNYTETLNKTYPNHLVCYAGKANSNQALLQVIAQEGLGVDVVSEGELLTAIKAGVDPSKILFHGNNKSKEELRLAIKNSVTVVIDNLQEVEHIKELISPNESILPCLIRLKPEIDAHTHTYIRTGQLDSKFGVSKSELKSIVTQLEEHPLIYFRGIHTHIGSQIFDLKPYLEAVDVVVETVSQLKDELGVSIDAVNLGGGFGIQYIEEESPLDIPNTLKRVCQTLKESCDKKGINLPQLILEPGRSIVGTAGITVYRVGTVKEIPEIKKYIFIDGGMADNPRPVLYQSQYTWAIDGKNKKKETQNYSIAGKFCESGDILAEDIQLPEVEVGDLLCTFGTGAYNYAMASNYNRFCRPAMVAVEDGSSKVWVRRETIDDLLRLDQVGD